MSQKVQLKKLLLDKLFSFYASGINTKNLISHLVEKRQYESVLKQLKQEQIKKIRNVLETSEYKAIDEGKWKDLQQEQIIQAEVIFDSIKKVANIDYLKYKYFNDSFDTHQFAHLAKSLNRGHYKKITSIFQKGEELFQIMKKNQLQNIACIKSKIYSLYIAIKADKKKQKSQIIQYLDDNMTEDVGQQFDKMLGRLQQFIKSEDSNSPNLESKKQKIMDNNNQKSNSQIIKNSSEIQKKSIVAQYLIKKENEIQQSILSQSKRSILVPIKKQSHQIDNYQKKYIQKQLKKIIQILEEIQLKDFKLKDIFKNKFQELSKQKSYIYRQQQIQFKNYNHKADNEYYELSLIKNKEEQPKINELNSFIIKFKKYFQQEFSLEKIKMFKQKLFQWKNQKIKQIKNVLISEINDKKKQLYEQKLTQIKSISVQIIIQQIVSHFNIKNHIDIFSSIELQQIFNFQPLEADYYTIAQKYYEAIIQNKMPLNILIPDTLTFGNHFIKDKFEQIDKKNKKNGIKKNIYVISIIGIQSSAKSYLLNKLFESSFQVSGGRCTMGIFMIIVQHEDKTLIVLDTEGVSSNERNDLEFDIRLTSFVMLMSDVLIINSKGQLDKSLTTMIDNCMFVLNSLNFSQEMRNNYFRPQRIIFIERDIDDLSQENRQDQALRIIRYIDKININNKIKMQISSKDVFIFSSLIKAEQQNMQKVLNQLIDLKKTINNDLKQPKHLTLKDFFYQGNRNWHTLTKLKSSNLYKFNNEKIRQIKQSIVTKMYAIMKKIESSDNQDLKNLQNKIQLIDTVQLLNSQWKELFNKLRGVINEEMKQLWKKIDEQQRKKQWHQVFQTIRSQVKNQILIFQLNQENKLRISLQNIKIRLMRLKYEQKISLEIKLLIKQNKELVNIDKLQRKLRLKQKVNEMLQMKYGQELKRNEEEIKNQTDVIRLFQTSQNIEDINCLQEKYVKGMNLHKMYYYLQNKIKEELQTFAQLEKQFVILSLHDYRRIYQNLTKNVVSQKYILQYFLLPTEGKSIYAVSTIMNIEIIYFIIDFFKSATNIIENIISKFDFQEENDVSRFSRIIKQKLFIHYISLKKNIQFYYPDLIIESQILEVQKMKINEFSIFRNILYSILPIKMFIQTIKKTKEKTQRQNICITRINKRIQSELKYMKEQKFLLCQNWYRQFIRSSIRKNKRGLLKKIEIRLMSSLVKSEKIVNEILAEHIFTFNRDTMTTEKLIDLFKLTINMQRFIIENYNKNFFNIKILPKIKQIIADETNHLLRQKELFKANVIQLYQLINAIQEEQHQVLLESNQHQNANYVYQFLLNGDFLFLGEMIESTHQGLSVSKEILQHFKVLIQRKDNFLDKIYQKELDELNKTIEEFINKTLQRQIYPLIIGCRQKCPRCGMKCFKEYNHTGSHEIIPGGHLLWCFKAQKDDQRFNNNTWCCQLQYKDMKLNLDEQSFHDPLMGWYYHFKNSIVLASTKHKQLLELIWANIGEVICKMKGCNASIANQMRTKMALTMKHLKEEGLQEYHIQFKTNN